MPEFEGFGVEERIIDGQAVRVPVLARPVGAFFVDDHTPQMWQEPDGSWWKLGRYLDGGWFKRCDS